MAKYSIHAGHNHKVVGARGFIAEENVNRKIKDAVIKYLKRAGHTVYDDTDEVATTRNGNLANICKNVNAHSGVALMLSVHLNAGGGTGFEIWQYNDKTDAVAARILNNVCKVTGLRNRGVKKSTGLWVLRNTEPNAILIECGFVDTKHDADVVSSKTDEIGKAIAEGIIGKGISSPKKAEEKHDSAPKKDSGHIYRVRKSAKDAGSQIGAFKDKGNAVDFAKKHRGYEVYDEDGHLVYGKSAPKPAPKAKSKRHSGSAIVPYPGKLINRGDTGKDVQRIQRAVNVTPDGIFGRNTEAAVKAYQRRHGLSADGIVGPATWNVMF